MRRGAEYWREAINKELAGTAGLVLVFALGTCSLLHKQTCLGSNLMHCHYVFAVKRKGDGSIKKFKARLVADVVTQKHGVDFERIFATVVKTQSDHPTSSFITEPLIILLIRRPVWAVLFSSLLVDWGMTARGRP